MVTNKAKNRGFASMDPKRQKEIASLGGRTAHARGTAHQFTSEEAKIAGSKGGKSRRIPALCKPDLSVVLIDKNTGKQV